MVDFNEEQLEVINSKEKKIFLLSGAGTGKTTTILGKIKSLLDNGVSAKHILAITFTRKGSLDLKERAKNQGLQVMTFHSLCYKELLDYYKKPITLLSDDVYNVVDSSQRLKIGRYKNGASLIKPKGYKVYQNYLESKGFLDFDDLQNEFIKVLKADSLFLMKLKATFKYIFVDEFQDTNVIQYRILKLLCNSDTNVWAVGDTDQSIYAFRGANSAIVDKYIKDFDAKVFTLSDNYRSGKKIIEIANNLINHNYVRIPKTLNARKEEISKVEVLSFKSISDECKKVIELISYHIDKGTQRKEIVILVRNHNRVSLLKNQLYKSSYKDINILTIHQAKGLEFDVVIILGAEGGTMPSSQSVGVAALEEERRLMFVAITRARYFLYITEVKNNYGTKSSFINECRISKK